MRCAVAARWTHTDTHRQTPSVTIPSPLAIGGGEGYNTTKNEQQTKVKKVVELPQNISFKQADCPV